MKAILTTNHQNMTMKTITKDELAQIAYDSALFNDPDQSEDCPRTLSLPTGEYTVPEEFEDGQESYVIWGELYEDGEAQRREYEQREYCEY